MEEDDKMKDSLVIGGEELESRLLTGTGKFAEQEIIPETIAAAGTEVVTMALRRVNFDAPSENVNKYISVK